MQICKITTITCTDGDFQITMGKALTSIYFKEQEKIVLRANEVDKIIEMLQASKKALDEK